MGVSRPPASPALPLAPARRTPPVDIGKPRLRGWLHTYAFFTAIVAGIALVTTAATIGGGGARAVACAIYTFTVCALFGTSALYHRRAWSGRALEVMRRLDHSMIFVFIAGTYTPFCILLLAPKTATVILSIVWGGAILGVGMKLIAPFAPLWLSAPAYIGVGWVAIFVLPEIGRAGGVTTLALILAGGVFYTVGAACFAMRWPNPWPKTFGHHECFHAFTLVAALCHYIAVYFALFH